MKFVRGSTEDAVRAICERISSELQAGKRVLWLTSGGSNTQLEVEIMQKLRDHAGEQLAGLAIMPMDERYGPAGFKDSNVQQLREAGFNSGTAVWLDVLARDLPFAETVSFYSDAVATALANAQVVVGQFGMGDDTHVAGIKPDSPATSTGSATVIGYNWDDYVRMTMSAEALLQISVAYVPTFGTGKKKALERLKANDEPFEKLPAKILYDIDETYVYTDQLESED